MSWITGLASRRLGALLDEKSGDLEAPEVAIAEHADQNLVLYDRHVPDVEHPHQVPHLGDARLGRHGRRIRCHQIVCRHECLLSAARTFCIEDATAKGG
jgi:hypothetical protein